MGAATATATTTAAAAGHDGAQQPKGKGGKRKLLLLAVPLLVLLLGAGAYFGGLLDPLLGHKPPPGAEPETARHEPPTYVDLPDLITNLDSGGRHGSYVKLRAKIEVTRASDVPAVQAAMPRILDLLQTYLREMRPEELRGSEGTYRLREELLSRIEIAVAPARVDDVLFVELMVQ
jgi:flagellar protein FliL